MAAPEGQARGVEIDIDGRMIGIRYPMDAHLIGDAKETLRVLIPMLERKSDRSWRADIEENVAEWWRILDGRPTRSSAQPSTLSRWPGSCPADCPMTRS
jgi:pyruvate dehydrogenase (quinone)